MLPAVRVLIVGFDAGIDAEEGIDTSPGLVVIVYSEIGTVLSLAMSVYMAHSSA